MNQQLLIVALVLCNAVCPSWQIRTRLNAESTDINLSGIFQKISNLEFVAFDKKNSVSSKSSDIPESIEMVMLDDKIAQKQKKGSYSIKAYGLKEEELNDVMFDTFKEPEQHTLSVHEILQKEESDEEEKKQEKHQSLEQKDQNQEEEQEMTITEQMKQVKRVTQEAMKMQENKEEQDEEKKKEEKRQKKIAKKKKEEAKLKVLAEPKQDNESEMDDFVEKQLEKQREDRARYDNELLTDDELIEKKRRKDALQASIAEMSGQNQKLADKDSEEENTDKKGFKSADEALDHYSNSLAEHELNKQLNKKEEPKVKTSEELAIEEEDKKEQLEKKKEQEEKKKIAMAEKKKDDEEQRLIDDRKNRLQEKLASLTDAEEEKSPGFMEKAQDNEKQFKNQKQEEDEKNLEKERAEIAHQNLVEQEQKSIKDSDEERKKRLQEKLDDMEGDQNEEKEEEPEKKLEKKLVKKTKKKTTKKISKKMTEELEEQPEEKQEETEDNSITTKLQSSQSQINALVEEVVEAKNEKENKARLAQEKARKEEEEAEQTTPPTDNVIQHENDVNQNDQILNVIKKKTQNIIQKKNYQGLVEQVLNEQQVKAASTRKDEILLEQQKQQQLIKEQQEQIRELELEKQKKLMEQQEASSQAQSQIEEAMKAESLTNVAVQVLKQQTEPIIQQQPQTLPQQLQLQSQSQPVQTLPSSPATVPVPVTTPAPTTVPILQSIKQVFDIKRLIKSKIIKRQYKFNDLQKDTVTHNKGPAPEKKKELQQKPAEPVVNKVAPKIELKKPLVTKIITPAHPILPQTNVVAKQTPKKEVETVKLAAPILAPTQALTPTPSTPQPTPVVEQISQERLNARIHQEMQESGVKEPSDITKALAESQELKLSGEGFVGKFLMKHRDMKKKAEESIMKEDQELEEKKSRMKQEMSQKIKADPVIKKPDGTTQVVKKKKQLTLSERAHQKLIDEENAKSAEAQEKAQMVVQVSQLAQLQAMGLGVPIGQQLPSTLH